MKLLFSLCLSLMLLLSPSISPAQSSNSSASSNLGFGGVVATNGEHIFVGSANIGWPKGLGPAGTVYQYTRNETGDWRKTSQLQASDGRVGDFFGRSLYFRGELLLIGAPGSGSVYVFEQDDSGSWQETGKISPPDLGPKMDFGGTYARGGYRTNTIAMAGNRIVVSAYPKVDLNIGSGVRALNEANGAVYVFSKETDTWKVDTVFRQDESINDGFGFAIAAEDDHILVSAPGVNENRGALYSFDYDSGSNTWNRSSVTLKETLTPGSTLGVDIALIDQTIYVSAPGFDSTGVVFTLERSTNNNNWHHTGRFPHPETTTSEGNFAARISASGNTLIHNGPDNKVFAYQKQEETGLWNTIHVISPDEDRIRRSFGVGLAVSGHLAVIGSPLADFEEGTAMVYEYDTHSNAWKKTAMLLSDVSALDSVRGDKVPCQDGTAGMFECDRVDLISFVSLKEISSHRGVKLTDIWGWEDPETGVEYVLQGRQDGVAFINIGDPYNPFYVGQLMKTEGSPGSNWRDVKVYKNHAFIVSDGANQHGMQVFDLTQLRDVDPADMPVEFEETVHYDGIASSHNIVINEETGYAYAVGNDSGGKTCGGQLHMINIQDPRNPTFAGCFVHEGGRGTHDAQCVIYRGPDARYRDKEICFNSNGSQFVIADVTNKEKPVTVANTMYPNIAYTHQGWLSEDQRYFYMNDELDEMNGSVDQTRTLIWDVTELDDPLLVKEFMLDSRASDHNLYIRGNLLYESNYQAGLRILDITDPVNPVEVGYFDTVPSGENVPGFGGSWSNYPYFKNGIIAVSSQGEGMFLLKKQEVGL